MKNYFTLSAVLSLFLATGVLFMTGGEKHPEPTSETVEKFESEKAFQNYVSSPSQAQYNNLGSTTNLQAAGSAEFAAGDSGSSEVERSSTTNIQVSGVSEPDILKNAGEKIYYSQQENNYGIYWRDQSSGNTSVFSTLPAENFSEKTQIPDEGRMFLTNNSVISLGESIAAYSRESYQKNWELDLNSSEIVSARKINSSLYLVLRKQAKISDPCPVRPMKSVSIPCTEFYRPAQDEGSQTTYTVAKINAQEGEVTDTAGFVGSGDNTVVYVSRDSIYLTYSTQKSENEVLLDFLDEQGSEFLDQKTVNRIEDIQGYNLSDRSKQIEIERAIENYRKTLGENESEKLRKEFETRWSNYTNDRKRELSTTGIAKFDKDLDLEAQGSVPGRVNDQFSLSEKDGNFRIATTVGSSWQFNAESANDLYVLDEQLDMKGEIKGLGLTERIYSVRYVNDKAYVVTFRRVDPFHVIDLSEPSNPELEGKLKLPGFSSYLHPLSEDRILGIGEEEGNVKAVIFDVSNGEPTVEESKVLDDWYSDISDSHHAFKIDRKHKVFFLPGNEGGHVFSYREGLEQVKQVNMTDVKRATYVNDNLYVFSDTNATVIDEKNWNTVKEIQFAEGVKRDYPGPIVREPDIVR